MEDENSERARCKMGNGELIVRIPEEITCVK